MPCIVKNTKITKMDPILRRSRRVKNTYRPDRVRTELCFICGRWNMNGKNSLTNNKRIETSEEALQYRIAFRTSGVMEIGWYPRSWLMEIDGASELIEDYDRQYLEISSRNDFFITSPSMRDVVLTYDLENMCNDDTLGPIFHRLAGNIKTTE